MLRFAVRNYTKVGFIDGSMILVGSLESGAEFSLDEEEWRNQGRMQNKVPKGQLIKDPLVRWLEKYDKLSGSLCIAFLHVRLEFSN